MAAKVIVVGIQKGGCAKTTTTSILAHLLAEQNQKILCIDTDSQGNLSDVLTQQDLEDFSEHTLFEAIKEEDLAKYIVKTENENIDVVVADDYLALVPRYLYTQRANKINYFMRDLIAQVKVQYDYILIDTPPSLSEFTIASIVAADHVLVLSETSKWSLGAIGRFLETVSHAQQNFSNVKVAGILLSMQDSRRSDNLYFLKKIQEQYGDLVLNKVIKRKASTGRISAFGFSDNPELKDAIREYRDVINELKERGVLE
ncbi:ParA family protein [Bacillus sp. AFS077874]|uniref:ParA family protein n=1 Tax=Bacillus sp. AFS077874 TaxID=2033513 RepID=UPI0015968CC1|nr:ParA family protein [Bacillus sp. AFS077874]